MIAPFGSWSIERVAMGLLLLAAGFGFFASGTVTGVASAILGSPWPSWFIPNPGRAWMILQSLLVVAGVLGAFIRSFTLATVGIGAALVFVTPTGLLTLLPGLLMLCLMVPRRRAFWEFTPRWRGPGPPPPGQWR